MKWPTMDEFAQMVADKAIDEVEYNGKTIREWTEIILAADNNVATKDGTNLASLGTDCISRRDALEAFGLSEKTRKYGGDHSGYDTMMMYEIQDTIENLPPIQPASSSEIPNSSDAISREQVIDALVKALNPHLVTFVRAKNAIEQLPPIQPEIVRCKDCKYARLTNDGSCKYCDIWFPDEAEYMDGDYYCASAERKSNG